MTGSAFTHAAFWRLVVLCLVACAPHKSPGNTQVSVDNFTLDVPASWRRDDGADSTAFAVFGSGLATRGTSSDDIRAVGMLRHLLTRFVAYTPDLTGGVQVSWMPVLDSFLVATQQDSSVTSRRPVRLPAGEALELRTTFDLGPVRQMTLDYYFRSPSGTPYALRFGAGAERFDELLPVFQEIAQSLRWTPAAPLRLTGFTALPPDPRWWVVSEQADDDVWFARFPTSETHTFSARARALQFPVTEETPTLENVARAVSDYLYGDPRYRNRRLHFTEDAGPGCIRVDARADDHGVPSHPGRIFLEIDNGLVCQHPVEERWFALVFVSQRFLRDGEMPLDLRAETQSFFEGLQATFP